MDKRLQIFAERLKYLRDERGWTQEELAEKLGTKKSLISYYENCKRQPGIIMLSKMREVFDESADYIMGDSDVRRLKKSAG